MVSEVEKAAAEQEKRNQEAEKRMTSTKPTPTQKENDAARLGQLDIDQKEADGSPEQVLRVLGPAPAGPGYQTREGGGTSATQATPGAQPSSQVPTREQLDTMTKAEVTQEATRNSIPVSPSDTKSQIIDNILALRGN